MKCSVCNKEMLLNHHADTGAQMMCPAGCKPKKRCIEVKLADTPWKRGGIVGFIVFNIIAAISGFTATSFMSGFAVPYIVVGAIIASVAIACVVIILVVLAGCWIETGCNPYMVMMDDDGEYYQPKYRGQGEDE